MKKFSSGFTLIELLVVISIIGMISSILLVSIQSARDKGRVASSLVFATTMYRGWGAEALGVWDFNEASGPANDLGPNGINLTANGASARSTVRPGSSGYSLNYLAYSGGSQSNITDYFVSEDLSQKNINLIAKGGYTASAWIYRDNNIGGRIFTITGLSSEPVPNDHIAFINTSSSANAIYLGPRASSQSQFLYIFPVKQWIHVAYSYNHATSQLRLYINGKFVSAKSITPVVTSFVVNKIAVGLSYTAGPDAGQHFYGYMDDLAIYTDVLTADNIQHIYAEGLKKHTLARLPDDLTKVSLQ